MCGKRKRKLYKQFLIMIIALFALWFISSGALSNSTPSGIDDRTPETRYAAEVLRLGKTMDDEQWAKDVQLNDEMIA